MHHSVSPKRYDMYEQSTYCRTCLGLFKAKRICILFLFFNLNLQYFVIKEHWNLIESDAKLFQLLLHLTDCLIQCIKPNQKFDASHTPTNII